MEELDRLLQRLEAADLDLDELAAAVERAAELLTFCRAKLDATTERVNQVLSRTREG
jgi:exodeoxyribonuclease VII small subunit